MNSLLSAQGLTTKPYLLYLTIASNLGLINDCHSPTIGHSGPTSPLTLAGLSDFCSLTWRLYITDWPIRAQPLLDNVEWGYSVESCLPVYWSGNVVTTLWPMLHVDDIIMAWPARSIAAPDLVGLLQWPMGMLYDQSNVSPLSQLCLVGVRSVTNLPNDKAS